MGTLAGQAEWQNIQITASKRRKLSHDYFWVLKLFLSLIIPLLMGVVRTLPQLFASVNAPFEKDGE